MPANWTPLSYTAMRQGNVSRFFGGHQYYKDGNGDYQDVDYTLIDMGSYWELTKASYNLIIYKDFAAPTLLQFTNKYEGANHTISYDPFGIYWVNADNKSERQLFRNPQSVTGVYDSVANKVVWTNAFGNGVDFEVIIRRSGIRKWIVAKTSPPAGPYTNNLLAPVFKWTATGLTVKPVGGVDWDEVNYLEADEFTIEESANRSLKSYIARAYAHDSSPEVRGKQLKVFFDKIGGALYQAKLIPEDLLQQATYPVYADTVTNYWPGAGDGYAHMGNSDWDTLHDSSSADFVVYTADTLGLRVSTQRDQFNTDWAIRRGFVPIDTSALSASANITAASLKVYVEGKADGDNDGDDWITVVQGFQASTSTLEVADYDNCGDLIDNPTEGIDSGERKDLTSVATAAYLSFLLNSTGRGWIVKGGWSKFGLREGHDVIDSPLIQVGNTYNNLDCSGSETTGTSQDPYLEVTYNFIDALTATGISTTPTVGSPIVGGPSLQNKTFPFATTAESFTGNPASGDVTMSYDGSVGNPAGALKSRIFGRNNVGNNNYWEWSGTWENLGIPSGSTVVQIRLNGAENRCTEWNVGDSATIGPYSIYDSAGTSLIATLWTGRSPTGSEGSWTSVGTQAKASIGSAYQASSTTIKIRLYNSLDTGNNANAAISIYDDQISLDIYYVTPSDDLTANSITVTPVVGTPTIGQKHALTATAISTTPTVGNPTLSEGGTDALSATGISTTPTVGTPTLGQVHALAATGITSNPVIGVPDFASDSVYGVTESNWFFSPGNWYKSGSTYAITNSPGAYTKLRFIGTGIKFTINLSLFEASSPGSADFPYFKWRTDGASWSKQIMTTGQTTFVFESGLSNTTHDIEIYFESIARNRDRWTNPTASVRVDNVTITAGVLLTPTLASERWLVFGDSRVEGVNVYGSSYSNADQGAARSWAIQIGELQGAEVGSIGWVSQGFNWPSSVASNVDEFHKYDESSKTWTEIFNAISRSFTGIDTIIVNEGVNDNGTDESQLRTAIYDFLVDIRAAAPTARIILLIPFGDQSYFTTSFDTIWSQEVVSYIEATSDTNVYLLSITGINSTLDYDLAWQTPTTYSYDGGHPNQAGHDLIATLLDGVLDSDNPIAESISTTPTVGNPTLTDVPPGTDNLTATGITTTPTVGAPTLGQVHALTATGISTTPVTENSDIGQEHSMSATGVTTTPVTGAPAIAEEHNLSSTGITTTPVMSSPDIGQIHAISVTGITTTPVLGTPTLSTSGIDNLSANSISTTPTVDNPTIGQMHVISVNGIESTPVVGTPTLSTSGVDNLLADSVSTTPTVGTPTLGQVHSLLASGITVNPVVDPSQLGQIHALIANGISATPVVGIPTIGLISNLVAIGITVNPTLDTPILGQSHVLDSIEILTGPIVGSPAIGQIHALTAVGITTTPVLGSPGFDVILGPVGVTITSFGPVVEISSYKLVQPTITSYKPEVVITIPLED